MTIRPYRKHNKDTNHQDFPHGEFAGYKAGCKCEKCMSANSAHVLLKRYSNLEYLEKHRQTQRENKRKYRQTEHGKLMSYVHNRTHKLRKLNQVPEDLDIKLLTQIYKNCPDGHHVDHKIPLAKGGLHEPDNLQYLPAKVNLQKSDNLDFDVSLYAIKWEDVIWKFKDYLEKEYTQASGSA